MNFANTEGHLKIPRDIRLGPEKLNPAQWMELEKTYYRNKESFVTKKRIKLCEEIPGWFWETSIQKYHNDGFKELKLFVKENGHPFATKEYVTEGGYPLGDYLLNLRGRKRKGNLQQSEIDKHESLPYWNWDAKEGWWYMKYSVLQRFARKFKHSDPELDEIFDDERIGGWVRTQKKLGSKLPKEKIKLLELLPKWSWKKKHAARWMSSYERVLDQKKEDLGFIRSWTKKQKISTNQQITKKPNHSRWLATVAKTKIPPINQIQQTINQINS